MDVIQIPQSLHTASDSPARYVFWLAYIMIMGKKRLGRNFFNMMFVKGSKTE